MCYNCGCQLPEDDHGDPRNITNKTFEDAAKAAGQSMDEAKENTASLINKEPMASEEMDDDEEEKM